jgi:hypothetical protein
VAIKDRSSRGCRLAVGLVCEKQLKAAGTMARGFLDRLYLRCFALKVMSSLYCVYRETIIFISSISIVYRTTRCNATHAYIHLNSWKQVGTIVEFMRELRSRVIACDIYDSSSQFCRLIVAVSSSRRTFFRRHSSLVPFHQKPI